MKRPGRRPGRPSTKRGASIRERLAFYSADTPYGCVEWVGYIRNTYGSLNVDGRHQFAHRLAYELHKGPIPKGHQIDHLCRNRICINPLHLEAVTPQVNMRRGMSPGAIAIRRDLCDFGHPFDDYGVVRAGRRVCRICRNTYSLHYQSMTRQQRAERRKAGLPIVDLAEALAHRPWREAA